MSRPKKWRRVCDLPANDKFVPNGCKKNSRVVEMTIDEYETIRLIDNEGLTQEEAGKFLGVARTTVQAIYTSARKKLSEMLVENLPLKISGGDFELCSGDGWCGCETCNHRRCLKKENNSSD